MTAEQHCETSHPPAGLFSLENREGRERVQTGWGSNQRQNVGSRKNVTLGEGGGQKQKTKQASENRQKSGGKVTGAGSRLQGKAKLRVVMEGSPGSEQSLGR